jgi:hypothetical protein
VDYTQAELSFESVKVVVTMQKLVPCTQTEGCDYAVYGSSNGVAFNAQGSIINGGSDRQHLAASFEQMEGKQFVTDLRE